MKYAVNNRCYYSLFLFIWFILCFFPPVNLNAQNENTGVTNSDWYGLRLDTVKAQPFDMGKMWTFENPPIDYFQKTYGFSPSPEWLEKARKSALRFGYGCSASFVSGDGLIMTNHHCWRGNLASVQKEGENLLRDGFFAQTLADERPAPNLFVDQLLVIEDVTARMQSAMGTVSSEDEKILKRKSEIAAIEKEASERKDGLQYKVVSLYNGGRFSLYGYKRYTDIRLVFAPDLRTAKLGGDYDNFTFPRYGLDCLFFRAYGDDGKPIKTENYFKWNPQGAATGEAVFVVGNPGSTNRIYTLAQIQTQRDIVYPILVPVYKLLYALLLEKVKDTKAEDYSLISSLYSVGNGLKVYEGTYKALLDPYLLARKASFEKEFRASVAADPKLSGKYGALWDAIAGKEEEMRPLIKESYAYRVSSFYSSMHFIVARNLLALADQLSKPEAERDEKFRGEKLALTIAAVFPETPDVMLESKKLPVQLRLITGCIGTDDPAVIELTGGKPIEEAAAELLSKTITTSREKVLALANSSPSEIYASTDPFIAYLMKTRNRLAAIDTRLDAIRSSELLENQMLGEALFSLFGETIPPDATGTLRISDGVLQGYDYNGTRAPVKTTFYGSLDRYYSFDKEFPYNLPHIWENLPEEFDLSTPLNFISTNDIIGGNSGSPVINIKGEIVGLAFDGNIESLPARFIYTTEANRTVSVHSAGITEALKDLYKAERLYQELMNGKTVSQ